VKQKVIRTVLVLVIGADREIYSWCC